MRDHLPHYPRAALFFSRNSFFLYRTTAAISTNGVRRRSAQGDEFSLTLYDTQRLLDACAYFLLSFIWNMKLPRKSRTTVTSPTTRRVFPVEGDEIHQLVFDSDLYPLPKSFSRSRSIGSTLELFSASSHRSGTLFPRTPTALELLRTQFYGSHGMYALDGYRLSVERFGL